MVRGGTRVGGDRRESAKGANGFWLGGADGKFFALEWFFFCLAGRGFLFLPAGKEKDPVETPTGALGID